MVPMAITSCTEEVYQAFYSDDIGKGLFHGHTYSANPIACAAALAGIELLQTEEMQANIQRVIKLHENFDKHIKNHPKIASTRQCGIIYAIDLNVEMERYGNLRDKLLNFFLDNELFMRPLGSTLYISAAYVITDKQLQKIYDKIEFLIEKIL